MRLYPPWHCSPAVHGAQSGTVRRSKLTVNGRTYSYGKGVIKIGAKIVVSMCRIKQPPDGNQPTERGHTVGAGTDCRRIHICGSPGGVDKEIIVEVDFVSVVDVAAGGLVVLARQKVDSDLVWGRGEVEFFDRPPALHLVLDRGKAGLEGGRVAGGTLAGQRIT